MRPKDAIGWTIIILVFCVHPPAGVILGLLLVYWSQDLDKEKK